MYGGRLTAEDMRFAQTNQVGQYVMNPNSYHYEDILTHIPVQRKNHQYASYDYRTNQMIKHAYEDNMYMTRDMIHAHTSAMNGMNSRDAYNYALGQGWKK
jgi:hypothetical protein